MMTSNFTNIIKVFVCFVLLISVIGCEVCENQASTISNHQYEINELNSAFELVFYTTDSQKELIRKTFMNEPLVLEIKKNLFKVVISSGVNSSYSFFVDVEKEQVSDLFFNLLYNDTRRVAFLKDKTIIFTGIFNCEKIIAEIERDFSETAVPQSAILSFEVTDDVIHIKYLMGEDYTEVYEDIKIKTGDGSVSL